MKEYLAPEIEKVEYDVLDCLATSGGKGITKESENTDDIFNNLI